MVERECWMCSSKGQEFKWQIIITVQGYSLGHLCSSCYAKYKFDTENRTKLFNTYEEAQVTLIKRSL